MGLLGSLGKGLLGAAKGAVGAMGGDGGKKGIIGGAIGGAIEGLSGKKPTLQTQTRDPGMSGGVGMDESGAFGKAGSLGKPRSFSERAEFRPTFNKGRSLRSSRSLGRR